MRIAFFLLAPLAAGAALVQARTGERDQDDLIRTGEKVFANRCASCHVAPDLTLKSDKVWLEMIRTTA